MVGIVGRKGISIGGSGGSCADATVEINGVEFDTVASGATIDIPVLQDGVAVGSIVDGEVIIPSAPVFGGCIKLTVAAPSETSLVTDTWVLVPSAESVLHSNGAEVNCEYLGNLRWELTKAGNYDYSMSAVLTNVPTSGNISVSFTIGIWDGSVYVPQTGLLTTKTLVPRNTGVSNTTMLFDFLFPNVAVAANGRVALMARRNSGSTNMYYWSGMQTIYKYVA
jgi:hypothetical protein